MNEIFYLDKENLSHLTYKKINHTTWKWLYKRVLSNMDKTLINPENIKKIIFNKQKKLNFEINGVLPYVIIRNEESWYTHDDGEDYYLPLSISFTDGQTSYIVVLIDGEIDLRIRNHDDENSNFYHIPMLVVMALKTLEECFYNLLEDRNIKNS